MFKSNIFSDLANILMSGGDTRILLQENNLNDVFTSPVPNNDIIQRASCTASYINSQQTYKLVEMYNNIKQKKYSFSQSMEEIRCRLRKVLQLSKDIGICTISSGTDAEYIPLWVIDNLFPQTKVCNIVCGVGELGSNSFRAARGFCFKLLAPSGSQVDINSSLFSKSIEAISIKRKVICGNEQINFGHCLQIIHNKLVTTESIVLFHILEPSKLGYRMDIIKQLQKLQKQYSNRLFFVVDACQSRTSVKRIHEYLLAQCFIMLTGAKFPEGPPFSGAVLIPSSLVKKCHCLNSVIPSNISKFVSYFDMSSNMKILKQSLKKWQNLGLMLRWSCALDNWEELQNISSKNQKKIIIDWLCSIRKIISNHDNLIFFCGGEQQLGSVGDYNTIISFKVLHNNKFLTKTQLAELRYQMLHKINLITVKNEKEKSALSHYFFIGQPVQLENFAVLRIAIGAKLISDIYRHGYCKFLIEDELLFLKLSLLAKTSNITDKV